MKCLHTYAYKKFHDNKGFTFVCDECGFETKLEDYENDAWLLLTEDRNANAKLNAAAERGYPAPIEEAFVAQESTPPLSGPEQIGDTHYQGDGIEPIDFIMANKLGFCEGNVIKYIYRHRRKNGKEDLLKAKQYIDFLLKEYE